MIGHVRVKGFKSLVDFRVEFSKFNCLVGLNGAGKSTVLQLFDFISSLHLGKVGGWLESRKWHASDLSFSGSRKQVIMLQVEVKEDDLVSYLWSANFNKSRLACTYERVDRIVHDLESGKYVLSPIFSYSEGKYSLSGQASKAVDFNFEGSILSVLRGEVIGEAVAYVNNYLKNIRSMDLLSPHLIRQKSRAVNVSDIGYGGEKLSVFLHSLSAAEKSRLVEDLKKYNPRVEEVATSKIRGGMVKIEILENLGEGQKMACEVRHVNDGLLRLLAINAQSYSANTFVLYDEIENGVNPEVTQALVRALMDSPKQTLVTTHSPVVLNFLSDQEAKDSVILIYKRGDGATRSIKLFDIPMINEKLDFLAPGEAVIDLPHSALAEEAEAILMERESNEK